MSIQAAMLPDGKRLHLQHGPIDLIIEADGKPDQVSRAYTAARARFETVLGVLAEELPTLRSLMPQAGLEVSGPIASRMVAAVRPHWTSKVTPMAAVAGSVADEMLDAMCASADLSRAYVNNGGDIALHLADGQTFSIASANGPVAVHAADPVRGIATSGWRGRSFSFGIADSVTVLAATAAQADIAATLVANEVDLPRSIKVRRAPAAALYPDSDLGQRRVTVEVAELTDREVATALERGLEFAGRLQGRGLIVAATLGLNDEVRTLDAGSADAGPAMTGIRQHA
ncbi:UPF0280 family protein [Anderseniella sp. Alg231-50]|uniref:UPF0280 family protein n=1 Tax=Anderseniella sp. Alg231-50 TaxID=1922226 RepID=UPI000D55A707